MFSYNTLIAIQLIHALHHSKGRRLTISELKNESRLQSLGYAVGRVVRLLKRGGWVVGDYRNRIRLAIDPEQKNLLELVIDIDEEIRLGSNALVGYWNMTGCGELPRVRAMSEQLRRNFIDSLDNISLGSLIANPDGNNALQTYASAEIQKRISGW